MSGSLPIKIARPILRELPYAVGVRLLRADGSPHDLSLFSVQSWLRDSLGAPTPLTVVLAGGLFVLSLSQAQTTALTNGNHTSDVLVRQGNEVFRRAELVYRVETPRTAWGVDPLLISTPDPVLEFRDQMPQVLQLPGGSDAGAAIAAAIAGHEAETDPHPQYFEILSSFAELDTQQKRVQARQNLELDYIDGGSF